MEESRMQKYQMGYAKLLQVVGRFCDESKLDEISLLEFDKGIVLQGLQVESTSEGYIRRSVTHTWSYDQLSDMARKWHIK